MYKYNNGWTLIGQPITAGNVVPAISDDGLTVIITTPVFDIIVYTYNGSTWVQLGETFSKNISTDTDFGKKKYHYLVMVEHYYIQILYLQIQ